MGELMAFCLVVAVTVFFTLAFVEGVKINGEQACAKEHNVFKCEQVITYVPVINGDNE